MSLIIIGCGNNDTGQRSLIISLAQKKTFISLKTALKHWKYKLKNAHLNDFNNNSFLNNLWA